MEYNSDQWKISENNELSVESWLHEIDTSSVSGPTFPERGNVGFCCFDIELTHDETNKNAASTTLS